MKKQPFAERMPERSAEVIELAVDAIERRQSTHGDPMCGFSDVARMWTVILGLNIEPYQVAICLDAVKTARILANPRVLDHWVDKAGYAALGAAVVEAESRDTIGPIALDAVDGAPTGEF